MHAVVAGVSVLTTDVLFSWRDMSALVAVRSRTCVHVGKRYGQWSSVVCIATVLTHESTYSFLYLSGKHSPSPCLYSMIPAYFKGIGSEVPTSILMIRIAISLSGVDSTGVLAMQVVRGLAVRKLMRRYCTMPASSEMYTNVITNANDLLS
jgi:hypothetical protein